MRNLIIFVLLVGWFYAVLQFSFDCLQDWMKKSETLILKIVESWTFKSLFCSTCFASQETKRFRYKEQPMPTSKLYFLCRMLNVMSRGGERKVLRLYAHENFYCIIRRGKTLSIVAEEQNVKRKRANNREKFQTPSKWKTKMTHD